MKPVVVSGVGRCGTSMIMAMLEAGGMKVNGSAPLYGGVMEMADSVPAGKRGIFLGDHTASKLLLPYLDALDPKSAYRFIWMVRDPIQQAMSQAKFAARTKGIDSDATALKQMADHNMKYAKIGLRRCQVGFGEGSTCYARRFEWCLENPGELADDLIEYLGLGKEMFHPMAAVVRKRPVECAEGMEFEVKP